MKLSYYLLPKTRILPEGAITRPSVNFPDLMQCLLVFDEDMKRGGIATKSDIKDEASAWAEAEKAVEEERNVSTFDPVQVMIYVTNKRKSFGSGSCDNANLIRSIAKDTYHTDKVYVIPSSIHEMIVCPVVGPVKDINKMIKEINHKMVSPFEQLGDHAYLFDFSE